MYMGEEQNAGYYDEGQEEEEVYEEEEEDYEELYEEPLTKRPRQEEEEVRDSSLIPRLD